MVLGTGLGIWFKGVGWRLEPSYPLELFRGTTQLNKASVWMKYNKIGSWIRKNSASYEFLRIQLR